MVELPKYCVSFITNVNEITVTSAVEIILPKCMNCKSLFQLAVDLYIEAHIYGLAGYYKRDRKDIEQECAFKGLSASIDLLVNGSYGYERLMQNSGGHGCTKLIASNYDEWLDS